MRFRIIRKRRRKPQAPFFVLPLNLAFEEILADLVFPAQPGG
ncbi:MAG TPA: hypothetical protein VGC03_04935 [Acidimicrobiia bacterium]